MEQLSTGRELQDRIDLEVDLIDSAMRLVASGAATRTIVAGLRVPDAAMTIAARRAGWLDVEIDSIWRPGESGHDVIVRRRSRRVAG